MDYLKEYKLHLTALVAVIISEWIGTITIPIGGMSISLLPLLYAMIITAVIYLIKPLKLLGEKQAKTASPFISLSVLLLMAKLGVSSGEAIEAIIDAGPVLLLQNLGNIGTLLIAMPVGLLLGVGGKELVGMTHSLGREANIALITDMYGAGSAEFKGVMTSYIVGTLFGTILMSFIPAFFVNIGLLSAESAAMGAGTGSGSMMAAGLASVLEASPDSDPEVLSALAGISNIISTAISVYIAIFITIPMGEWLVKKFGKAGDSNE